jgi:hypothetical protein
VKFEPVISKIDGYIVVHIDARRRKRIISRLRRLATMMERAPAATKIGLY